MIEMEFNKGIFEGHGVTLRGDFGPPKARFQTQSIALISGFCSGDRRSIGVRCGNPFHLALLSFKRIIGLVPAGKNKRIRKRVDVGEEVLLLRRLPLARVFLRSERMSSLKTVFDLVVRVSGDGRVVLLLLRCVIDTTPARFGARLRCVPPRVRICVRCGERPASVGLHIRFEWDLTVFKNGRWPLQDIRLRGGG